MRMKKGGRREKRVAREREGKGECSVLGIVGVSVKEEEVG